MRDTPTGNDGLWKYVRYLSSGSTVFPKTLGSDIFHLNLGMKIKGEISGARREVQGGGCIQHRVGEAVGSQEDLEPHSLIPLTYNKTAATEADVAKQFSSHETSIYPKIIPNKQNTPIGE